MFFTLYPSVIIYTNLQVDRLGIHVSGKGSWGHCASGCPLSKIEDYEEEEYIKCQLPKGEQGSCQPYGVCAGFYLDHVNSNTNTAFFFDQSEQSVEDECNPDGGKLNHTSNGWLSLNI